MPSAARGATGSHQLAIHLDHAGIAGLDGTKLGVIADLGNLDSATVDGVDQALPGLDDLACGLPLMVTDMRKVRPPLDSAEFD
jgi:hypothetical protein